MLGDLTDTLSNVTGVPVPHVVPKELDVPSPVNLKIVDKDGNVNVPVADINLGKMDLKSIVKNLSVDGITKFLKNLSWDAIIQMIKGIAAQFREHLFFYITIVTHYSENIHNFLIF